MLRLLTLLAVAPTLGASAGTTLQEAPDVTVLEPCRASCGIALVPDGEYGEDSGDGMIETSLARSWKDASGRLYLVGLPPSNKVSYSVPTRASLDESAAKEPALESSSSWAPSC